jgi:hypothetical protein
MRELTTFGGKVTVAAQGASLPWREGPHDDLVLAAAIAAWYGQRAGPVTSFVPHVLASLDPWR